MSNNSAPTRRTILAASAAAGALRLLPLNWVGAGEALSSQPAKRGDPLMASKDEIRPFFSMLRKGS
jgi:hypothetical protein